MESKMNRRDKTKLGRCEVNFKIKYPSKTHALRSGNRALKKKNRGVDFIRPYLCHHCGYWHLTSQHHKKDRKKL